MLDVFYLSLPYARSNQGSSMELSIVFGNVFKLVMYIHVAGNQLANSANKFLNLDSSLNSFRMNLKTLIVNSQDES